MYFWRIVSDNPLFVYSSEPVADSVTDTVSVGAYSEADKVADVNCSGGKEPLAVTI